MKVFVYTAADADAPARAIARIWLGHEWHPVIFAAKDEETARSAATEWWDAEVAKRANVKPRGRPRKNPADEYVL